LGRVGGGRRIVGWVWCGFVGSGHGVDAVTARGWKFNGGLWGRGRDSWVLGTVSTMVRDSRSGAGYGEIGMIAGLGGYDKAVSG
jgi:hypothetical protein